IRDGHVTGVQTCALPIFGIAQLVKFTLLILYPLWVALWVVCVLFRAGRPPTVSLRTRAGQLAVMMALSVYVINFGYEFNGTGTRSEERRVGKEWGGRCWR